VFACQECGGQQQKWLGRCPDCGAWNSFVEEQPAPQTAPAAASHRYGVLAGSASAKLYSDIQTSDAPRISSGIAEFDRVLGGGIVPGALVLLGGEPGIGKSTLLLQVAAHVAFTARARNRSIRSSSGASGWRWIARRCTCWPKPASSASSRKSSA
jgi:DNA repair protein RadA/Sms